jgi:phosphatidate cytidylyltransferase
LLRTRVITALVLASVITTLILFFPTWAVGWIIGIFWLGGTWEWAGLARLKGFARLGYLTVSGGLMLSMAYWGMEQSWVFPITVIAIAWWSIALYILGAYPFRIPLLLVGAAGPVALLPAWFLLTYLHGNLPQGPGLTMSILLIVWAADVGAYFVGSFWGRVKLASRVSPAKTWEGVIGGLLLVVVISYVFSHVLEIPSGSFVVISIAAAVSSVIGDLTVSIFKRNVNIKDSGRLLPGHGGILDRIDSLVAAIPIFTLGLIVAGLPG